MNDTMRIRQAVRTNVFDEALAVHLGVNSTDLRCLELLIDEPGITPGRLAVRSGLTTGAVTGVLDRLEHAGYVTRQPDPADRRSVTVQPVAEQVARVRAALAPLDTAIGTLLEGVSASERTAIARFLASAREIVTAETAHLTAGTRGGFVGDTFSAPLAAAARGRLQFTSGAPRMAFDFAALGPRALARAVVETSASRLRFTGAAPEDQLIRGTFSGPMPDVRASGGVATVRYRRKAASAFSTRSARIALSAQVPWVIELVGGITDLNGSLDGIALERLDIQGGANHIDLDLPTPSGTVGVRLTGGASRARFRRPPGVPVALSVSGGISSLRFDGQRSRSVGGRRRIVGKGFADQPDRFEIEVVGGVSDLRIDDR